MAKGTQAVEAGEVSTAQAKEGVQRRRKTQRIEAMRHPLRARMLRVLSDREVMSPVQLARALHADLTHVSYHMRRLEELECAEEVDSRPVRGAVEHFYRAIQRPLIDTDEYEELDPIAAEDLLLDCIQRVLDDFVASRKAKIVGYDKYFHMTRTPLILDEEGVKEGMSSLERHRLEMSEIERRSAERRSESGAPGIPASSNLLFFKVPSASLDT
jgi:hypothetical protein